MSANRVALLRFEKETMKKIWPGGGASEPSTGVPSVCGGSLPIRQFAQNVKWR